MAALRRASGIAQSISGGGIAHGMALAAAKAAARWHHVK